MAVDAAQLAATIKTMYPEIGRHQLAMDLRFDAVKKAWVVTLTKGPHKLETHVEEKDAAECLNGVECVYLGHQIGQFVRNYCEGGQGCAV